MANSVFSIPSPGKPNPYESPLNGDRSRVPFHGQKEATCSHYALNILHDERKRGKHPDVADTRSRNFEILLSSHRKQMTQLDEEKKIRLDAANLFSRESPKVTFNKRFVTVCKGQLLGKLEKQHHEKVEDFFHDFCGQEACDNLLAFAQEEREKNLIDVHLALIDELGIFNNYPNFREAIFEVIGKTNEKKWDDLTLIEKRVGLERVIFTKQCEFYDLQNSTWHPEQSIEGLKEQIQLHGPHYMKGHLGQLYYESPPLEAEEKIEGRPVFYWPADAVRCEKTSFHAFVVVGADENNVYLLDPIDGSEPDPSTQKLYRFSYELFKFYIGTLNSERMQSRITGQPVFRPPHMDGTSNYAVHK